MANTLGVYNPIFYANEGLAILYKRLGMASRVHLGYDRERRSFNKGQQIDIRRPSTFTAIAEPSGATQDITTDTVSMQLDQWFGVKMAVPDNEYAYSDKPRFLQDHVAPAMNALADNVDQALFALAADIPWVQNTGATTADYNDLVDTRTIMRTAKVPLNDPSMLHFAVNPSVEGDLLQDSKFIEWQGSGQEGADTQRTGFLGRKAGFEIFAGAHNVPTLTGGALTGSPLVQGAQVAKATSMTWDAGTLTGDINKGDTFTIAGSTQSYAVTADATAAGNAVAVTFTPPLTQAYSDNAAVTVTQETTKIHQNLAFHRNAFALVMPRLPDHGSNIGARIASVQDPFTGLSLRSKVWYDADSSEIRVAFDILYGVKTLDPNLACRMRHDT